MPEEMPKLNIEINDSFDARKSLEENGLKEGRVYKFKRIDGEEFIAVVRLNTMRKPQSIILEDTEGGDESILNDEQFKQFIEITPVSPEKKGKL